MGFSEFYPASWEIAGHPWNEGGEKLNVSQLSGSCWHGQRMVQSCSVCTRRPAPCVPNVESDIHQHSGCSISAQSTSSTPLPLARLRRVLHCCRNDRQLRPHRRSFLGLSGSAKSVQPDGTGARRIGRAEDRSGGLIFLRILLEAQPSFLVSKDSSFCFGQLRTSGPKAEAPDCERALWTATSAAARVSPDANGTSPSRRGDQE